MRSIVVDTSALAAIFKAEDDADVLAEAMSQASLVVVPASCLVEAALLRQVGRGFFAWIEDAMKDPRFEIGEISAPVAEIATKAARTYGRGSGHPAQLNFGDCLSYAVAEFRDLPLLFTGNDFSQTPIEPAVANRRT
ncbi:MAG: type II toxin-antitoxin system VapC family toxin [Hyphomicrobiales bacterium]|nr:type II toxin-antitoxin system VapC family toxin [Hyphomicrobiales bacterium]